MELGQMEQLGQLEQPEQSERASEFTDVSVRMETSLKEEIEQVFTDMGISIEAGFTILAKAVARPGAVPFRFVSDPLSCGDGDDFVGEDFDDDYDAEFDDDDDYCDEATDPFYSPANIAELKRRYDDIKAGRAQLIEITMDELMTMADEASR